MSTNATTLVRNERVKLTANALDRASTACLAVGVFGPAVAASYGMGLAAAGAGIIALWVGTALWLSAAGLLHVMARHELGRLQ